MLHFCLLLVDELNWLHYKAYLVSNLQFLVVAKTKLTVSSHLGGGVGLKQCSGCKKLPLPPRSPIPRSRSCYCDCFFCPKTEVLAPQKLIPQMSRVGQPQGKALSALATSSSSRSRWQCWPTRGQPSSHPPISLICWSVDNKYKSKLANQLTNSTGVNEAKEQFTAVDLQQGEGQIWSSDNPPSPNTIAFSSNWNDKELWLLYLARPRHLCPKLPLFLFLTLLVTFSTSQFFSFLTSASLPPPSHPAAQWFHVISLPLSLPTFPKNFSAEFSFRPTSS